MMMFFDAQGLFAGRSVIALYDFVIPVKNDDSFSPCSGYLLWLRFKTGLFFVAFVASNDFDDDMFRPFICFYLKKREFGRTSLSQD